MHTDHSTSWRQHGVVGRAARVLEARRIAEDGQENEQRKNVAKRERNRRNATKKRNFERRRQRAEYKRRDIGDGRNRDRRSNFLEN